MLHGALAGPSVPVEKLLAPACPDAPGSFPAILLSACSPLQDLRTRTLCITRGAYTEMYNAQLLSPPVYNQLKARRGTA